MAYMNATANGAQMPLLDVELCNILHFLLHSVRSPLSSEVLVQIQEAQLPQRVKGFNTFRDLVEFWKCHNI